MAAIPVCPLMSAGNEVQQICVQEKCAWYMNATKTCAMYVLAHKSVLEIKEKQAKK